VSNRRDFFRSMFGAAAVSIPAFREDGLHRIFSATAGVGARSPGEVATDEEFWFQIQQAFTVDRSIISSI
jgi:hypothetical protein